MTETHNSDNVAAAAQGPSGLTATAVLAGELDAQTYLDACLARIEARDSEVRAWQYLAADAGVRAARRQADAGAPLHGIPIGIKDIFDTADMPTELGSPIHAGRQPASDCTAVRLLREAGGLILGKTVTTEFALSHPAKTRNPHNLDYSPGGSSSGSAAAVADAMVPVAIGSQTGGSVIRPASFCGVVGYKPTFGSISRRGMKLIVRRLDHVGLFARTLEDIALVADVLMQPDAEDRDMRAQPQAELVAALQTPLKSRPRLAFVRTPAWQHVEPAAQALYLDFAREAAGGLPERELPSIFAQALATHATIQNGSLAHVFAADYRDSGDRLSATIKPRIEAGMRLTAAEYVGAIDLQDATAAALDRFFDDYDAVITPAAPGIAPASHDTTGNPVCNAIWTLCGAPAITLPLLQGEAAMPLGVQLVSRRGADALLIRVAQWLRAASK